MHFTFDPADPEAGLKLLEEQTTNVEHIQQHNGMPDPNSMVVDLAHVKIGQCYELLITTFSGLYRYRVGDILRVTGFHNNAPQFQFVQRRGVVLSVDQEKTSEEDLSRAITRAIRLIEPLGLLLKEYTSCVDVSSIPGHYVLFWELQTRENAQLPKLDHTLMEQCCFTVEQSLDSCYRMARNLLKDVGPLEIIVVNQGSFEALMDYYLSQGSSVSQYKTPRCIKSEKDIETLNSGVVARFFSKSVPFWKHR